MIINQVLKSNLRRNTISIQHSGSLLNVPHYSYSGTFPVSYTYENSSENVESSSVRYYFGDTLLSESSVSQGSVSIDITLPTNELDTINMLVVEITDQKDPGESHTKRMNYARILYGFDTMAHTGLALVQDGLSVISFNESQALTVLNIPQNGLFSVEIPDQYIFNGQIYDITEIGTESFYNLDRIREVSLGKNIKRIKSAAFRNMTQLDTVIIYAENPPILEGAGIFFGNEFNRIIKVPANSLELYRNSWAEYSSRIEAIVP
jgi:hypothetical protein